MDGATAPKTSRVDPAKGFAVDYLSNTDWHEKGLRAFLRYRDLGATAASGGRVRAEHIQALQPVTQGTGWHCHDLDFQFVYILEGHVVVTTPGLTDSVWRAGDCAHLPPFMMHDETEFSGDFEVLEITMPAKVETLTAAPADRRGRPAADFVLSRLGPDSFRRGEGPRAFLEYRELGVADATGRRVQAQVVRTNGACDSSTGWHYHTLDFQFVYVLNGWTRTELEGIGEFELRAGDSIIVPPHLRHDVTGFSEDFEVLEINVPADFDTISG
jgi:quercetin dioxygenase-like cupin family protein